ncbi:hypothetical protein D3C72_1277040 [compost metagenome]
MFLTGHALDGRILLVPDRGDVQQHIGAPFALLGLVRLEAVDRRCTDNFLARPEAFGLGDDARLLRQVHGQRVIVIVRVFLRVAEDELGLDATKHIRQAKQGFLVGTHRVVADVEELDAGTQDIGRRQGLLAPGVFDFFFTHLALAPQLGGLTALTEGQADDVHGITLLRVQRDGTARTPDEIGRVGADDQRVFR